MKRRTIIGGRATGLASLLLSLAASLMPLVAHAAPADAAPSCIDEYGTERCTAESRAKQRKLYGVEDVEAIATRKGQVARAFFVDGYGQDIGLLSMKRLPGEEPVFELRLPPSSVPNASSRPLVGALSAAAWDRIVSAGRYFDRDLVPLPQPKDSFPFCLHGWLITVEAVDARGKVRRKTARSCDDTLAIPYAYELADIAVEASPVCAMLDPDASRNAVTRLGDCARLEGDRSAAARAYNVIHSNRFLYPRGEETSFVVTGLFHDRAEVTWPGGARAVGMIEAGKFWSIHASEDRFWPLRYIGEGQNQVRVEGMIAPKPKSDEDRPKPIPVTMLWTRENGFDFRLRSFAPVAPAP